MYSIVILPIFAVAVLTGVESWLWRIILIGVVAAAWYYWGPACIAAAVTIIIGIAFKNSFSKISGSKL
jgi:hypothetical protein